ncbi:hypothetical protein [Anoxynatronum sibiricum]
MDNKKPPAILGIIFKTIQNNQLLMGFPIPKFILNRMGDQEAMATCQDNTMKGKLKHLYMAIMALQKAQPDQMVLLLKDRYFSEVEDSEEALSITSWLSPMEEEVSVFLEKSTKVHRFHAPLDQVLDAFDRLITGLVLNMTQEKEMKDPERIWELLVKGL